MKLRDMVRKKKRKETVTEVPSIGNDEEKYPYGLQVRFEKEDLEKLEIDVKNLSIDDKVSIIAVADVTDISQHKSRDGERQGLSLQITKMDVRKKISLKTLKTK